MSIIQKFKNWMTEPIDGLVMGLFRLVYGIFMIYNTYYYYDVGLIDRGLLAPKILFKYEGLEWLHPLSQPAMYGVLGLMGLSALLITTGLLFRVACWVFALSLSFLFFQEKAYYNNHIYLFILLAVLLSFTHADRFLSLRRTKVSLDAVPRWQQFILQAQVIIVYFYGGIVKMKADWLIHKEPVTSLVYFFPPDHWLGSLLQNSFSINLLTYGGFLIDILAPLLLWYKPVRRWALIPFIGFHLANSRIFHDIGIFPYLMLGSLILYFETREIPLLRKWARFREPGGENALVPATPVRVKNVLIGYFVFQVLFPFRGYFLPNPLDYTTIGNRFSWHMKADTRLTEEVKFFILDPATNREGAVDIRTFVNERQVALMVHDPRAVAAFARMLKAEAARMGLPGAVVKARIRLRYNGRPVQDFVRPDVDLASVPYGSFQKLDWVVEPSKK